MTFEECIKEFALNQGTQCECYEMDKNGVIISLIYKVVFGQLKVIKREKFEIILYTDTIYMKSFDTLLDALYYLSDNGIQFKEIIPTNLCKMFSII